MKRSFITNSFHSLCLVHHKSETIQKYIESILKEYAIHSVDTHKIDTNPVTIKDVKKLKLFLQQKPYTSTHKLVVLPGDELTLPAQHSLLKTLEEPPQNSIIILTTSNSHLLLPTILSRCAIIHIPDKSSDKITASLQNNTALQFWKSQINKSKIERLTIDFPESKNRTDFILWLERQIHLLRPEMIKSYQNEINATDLQPFVFALCLKALINTYNRVKMNCSLKLSVDFLWLEIP